MPQDCLRGVAARSDPPARSLRPSPRPLPPRSFAGDRSSRRPRAGDAFATDAVARTRPAGRVRRGPSASQRPLGDTGATRQRARRRGARSVGCTPEEGARAARNIRGCHPPEIENRPTQTETQICTDPRSAQRTASARSCRARIRGNVPRSTREFAVGVDRLRGDVASKQAGGGDRARLTP